MAYVETVQLHRLAPATGQDPSPPLPLPLRPTPTKTPVHLHKAPGPAPDETAWRTDADAWAQYESREDVADANADAGADANPQDDPDSDVVALTAVTTTFSAASVSTAHKVVILATVSWMTLAATFSSTSLLPATPEIAADYGTVVEVLNITNSGVLLAMGLASFLWVPLQDAFGRRFAYMAAAVTFTLLSVGIVFAPSLAAFTALRILAGFKASFFMVSGQAYLVDIFDPAYRGTAVGFFQVGTIAGPALGPCFGGIIVTYASWRVIFVLQTAMAASGLLSAFFCLPRAARPQRSVRSARSARPAWRGRPSLSARLRPPTMRIAPRALLRRYNPLRILRFLAYPNLALTDVACGLLSWTMYSLLTPSRDLIDARFHLTTPLVSGLFYLAPGTGFIAGAIGGGRLSDRAMLRYAARRGGLRRAQDRLNSGLYGFWLVTPAGMLLFGWSLQQHAPGGLVLPVAGAFVAGVGIMIGYNSLNTYTAEVIPGHKSEVLAGKYLVQYVFGAAGSATILMLINRIGVGLASTISRHGSDMQRRVEAWTKQRENVEQ